jgi:DNA-binding LacI/PurR family transcriptional regulator/DNA-binding transcriptional regulator YhcF (GntR family)
MLGHLAVEPFPSRGATNELERRMVGFLRNERPRPGSPLGTDDQLVSATNLSRSTVRRVMERLDRDGWVSRQAGRGTFVGRRVLMLDETGEPDAKLDQDRRAIASAIKARVSSPDAGPRDAGGPLRMAVLIGRIEDLVHDWFSLGVIAGMDAAAGERSGRVEIIGTRASHPHALAERLADSRPDALAFLSCNPEYLAVLDVSYRLGFPTILANTAFLRPGSSSIVCEDNAQGTRLAVDALVDAGHERIGLAINRWPEPWVFERHRAFEQHLSARGCDPFTCPVGWLDIEHDIERTDSAALEAQDRDHADKLITWLDRFRPTALVAGGQVVSRAIGHLVAGGRLRVPQDVSVVCFDQHPMNAAWYGCRPTTVEIPLNAIGRELFPVAQEVIRLQSEGAVGPRKPVVRRLPCTITRGQSIAAPGGSEPAASGEAMT